MSLKKFLISVVFTSSIYATGLNQRWRNVSELPGCNQTHIECFDDEKLEENEILSSLQRGYELDEVKGAIQIKRLHDQVEIAAYDALVNGIKELGITQREITEEQSKELLHKYVKRAAHVVMFASGGYMPERKKLLNFDKQIKPIMDKVNWIIHDRDGRLTNANYTDLVELVFALDNHNSLVNRIIFEAWGYPLEKIHTHLNRIKSKVNFYERLREVLGFDLHDALVDKVERFSQVRSHFSEVGFDDLGLSYLSEFAGLACIYTSNLELELFGALLSSSDVEFVEKLGVANKKTTVRGFFSAYFPEVMLPQGGPNR